MIVAQMALEAGEYGDARKAVASVLRNEPREGAFMLMADIEDAETGDQGKVREWLARAVRAPRDPAWTADGYVSETWLPVSPISGRLDAFEWKVPVERLGPVVENDLDPMVPGIAAASTPAVVDMPSSPAEMPPEPVPAPADAGDIAAAAATEPEIIEIEPEPVETAPETANGAAREAAVAAEATVEDVTEAIAEPDFPEPVDQSKDAIREDVTAPASKAEATEEEAFPPVPDDPGVDPDEVPEPAGGRFRLF